MKHLRLGKSKTIRVPPRPLLQIVLSDKSTWVNTDNYPNTQTCRRFVALVDYIAQNDKTSPWWTWRTMIFHPDWSMQKVGDFLGISAATVSRHLSSIPIPQDCFMSKAEREEAEWQCPIESDN